MPSSHSMCCCLLSVCLGRLFVTVHSRSVAKPAGHKLILISSCHCLLFYADGGDDDDDDGCGGCGGDDGYPITVDLTK